MHRRHEDDLAGHVLAQEEREALRFPAMAERDETHGAETVVGLGQGTLARTGGYGLAAP
jgi:hypothetical protein